MRAIGLYAIFLLAAPIVAAQGNPPVWRNGAQEKMCGLGTYYDSLDLAFKNATQDEGETLVTVQVLPSFHREYALVLKRVGQKVTLLHATLEKELWTQLGPPLSAMSRSGVGCEGRYCGTTCTCGCHVAFMGILPRNRSGNRCVPTTWKAVRLSSRRNRVRHRNQ
jgi:hypothetical protein